ncbi:MAG: hypothetical protein JWO85_565 [Candidatus Eremiobacteraeota bacterium]|nr:hypothetical protein [Candidatus Eremiobacteraeota bacterium]
MPEHIAGPLTYAALALAAAVVGFGWSFGCWLFAYLSRDRRKSA